MARDKLRVAGIVLCGGHSLRMGKPKPWLVLGNEVLLQRVVRILTGVVQPVIVVAASDQPLPALPEQVRVVTDRQADQGPLEGLLTGLHALADQADAAFVTSCDAPLLAPAFIQAMVEELGAHELAVPCEDVAGQVREHPLAAVYRTSILPALSDLRAAGERRLRALMDVVDTKRVPVAKLRAVDPELRSLFNCNTREEYQRAQQLAFEHATDETSKLRSGDQA